MATYIHNAIPCLSCWKAAQHKCCRNLPFLAIHESEADDFGRQHLEPFINPDTGLRFGDYWTIKWDGPDRSCPHLIDGRCTIHATRPNDCYTYPLLIGTTFVHFDLWCPGIADFIPLFKAGDPSYVEHAVFALQVARANPGYQEIMDWYMKDSNMGTECKMPMEDFEEFIELGSSPFQIIVKVVSHPDFAFEVCRNDYGYRIDFTFLDASKNCFFQRMTREALLKKVPEQFRSSVLQAIEGLE